MSVEPGWYVDPVDREIRRYWDGDGWIGAPIPVDATPPAGPPPEEPPVPPASPAAPPSSDPAIRSAPHSPDPAGGPGQAAAPSPTAPGQDGWPVTAARPRRPGHAGRPRRPRPRRPRPRRPRPRRPRPRRPSHAGQATPAGPVRRWTARAPHHGTLPGLGRRRVAGGDVPGRRPSPGRTGCHWPGTAPGGRSADRLRIVFALNAVVNGWFVWRRPRVRADFAEWWRRSSR